CSRCVAACWREPRRCSPIRPPPSPCTTCTWPLPITRRCSTSPTKGRAPDHPLRLIWVKDAHVYGAQSLHDDQAQSITRHLRLPTRRPNPCVPGEPCLPDGPTPSRGSPSRCSHW